MDGNLNLREWAELVGFEKLSTNEQSRLIRQGYYTKDGHRILTPEEPIGESFGIVLPEGERPESRPADFGKSHTHP